MSLLLIDGCIMGASRDDLFFLCFRRRRKNKRPPNMAKMNSRAITMPATAALGKAVLDMKADQMPLVLYCVRKPHVVPLLLLRQV
jgi:hypothetical protein